MVSYCLHQSILGVVLSLLFVGFVNAQGVRDYTRAKHDASVSVAQATELTLTVVKTEKQVLQTWVRAAAIVNGSKNKLTAMVCTPEANLIIIGQRVRAFPPSSKSSIYQSQVAEVSQDDECVRIVALLPRETVGTEKRYVMEIIAYRGEYLSIPNEAIIEEADHQIAYVHHYKGHYVPQVIRTGIRGELYTQILQGLDDGDEVVTFGSFFIDADYKLNKAKQTGTDLAHHNH